MGEALIRVVSQTWYKNDVEKTGRKVEPREKREKREKQRQWRRHQTKKNKKIEKNKKAQDTKKYK